VCVRTLVIIVMPRGGIEPSSASSRTRILYNCGVDVCVFIYRAVGGGEGDVPRGDRVTEIEMKRNLRIYNNNIIMACVV